MNLEQTQTKENPTLPPSYPKSKQPKTVYQTPYKNSQQATTQKSLKKSVLDRISSNKTTITCKQQPIKKLTMKQINKQLIITHQQQQLKQLILSNQSINNPGFYQYSHWIKFHSIYYPFIDKKYIENLWKILRLINYGQVLIPTGLIYQLFNDIKKNQQLGNFQKIINKFLFHNLTPDTVKGFKDLNNYIQLEEIQRAYKGKLLLPQNNKKPSDTSHSKTSVFKRVYSQAKILRNKRISDICDAVVEQSRQCYSKPKISAYKNQSFKSLLKPQRICHNAQKYKWKNQQQRFFQQCQLHTDTEKLFKAKILDKTIFEGDISEIPGVVAHLNRNYYSQAEKLRLKRFSDRPQQYKKKIY